VHSHALLDAALIVFWLALFGVFTWYFAFVLPPRAREHDSEPQQREDDGEREPGDLPLAA
jgi:hypothetical protein